MKSMLFCRYDVCKTTVCTGVDSTTPISTMLSPRHTHKSSFTPRASMSRAGSKCVMVSTASDALLEERIKTPRHSSSSTMLSPRGGAGSARKGTNKKGIAPIQTVDEIVQRFPIIDAARMLAPKPAVAQHAHAEDVQLRDDVSHELLQLDGPVGVSSIELVSIAAVWLHSTVCFLHMWQRAEVCAKRTGAASSVACTRRERLARAGARHAS
jgi:hypothetical protein